MVTAQFCKLQYRYIWQIWWVQHKQYDVLGIGQPFCCCSYVVLEGMSGCVSCVSCDMFLVVNHAVNHAVCGCLAALKQFGAGCIIARLHLAILCACLSFVFVGFVR
eukprot:m.120279 g.120279  ORF g.120279 m.120279 type:complete len:106 (+) comp13685_c0_seq1:1769-2086(+)